MQRISTYWKCQIAGWAIYLTIAFVFGLLSGGIDSTTLLKAVLQFGIAGIISTHVMRTVLLKMRIVEKSLKIQVLYLFCLTLCFSIFLMALFYFIELTIGFFIKMNMNTYGIFFIRASVTILIWNLIYFTYHHIEKSPGEQIEKIHIENELKVQKLESEKTKQLQQRAIELEVQALRSQMNPHFIFNCLNAINSFILQNEAQIASAYLVKFSDLIRKVLEHSQKKFISLGEELDYMELYIQLEQLRLNYCFTFRIDCDSSVDMDEVMISPLLLQPFVENAIWHGLMPKAGNGLLRIAINRDRDTLVCAIEDNGVGRQKAAEMNKRQKEKTPLGLRITEERIALLCEQETRRKDSLIILDLKNDKGKSNGTKVIVQIPVVNQSTVVVGEAKQNVQVSV